MIRTLLVDDHEMFRQGLAQLFQQNAEIDIIGEAHDGRAAVEKCRELHPDIVLMDVEMGTLNGIEATYQIMEAQPLVRVIGLSASISSSVITRRLRAGACGYVPKQCAFDGLLTAIHAVYAGSTYVSQQVAGEVILAYVNGDAESACHTTPRERVVLQLLAEGRSTKQIAVALHVSVKTVESHREHLMDKLGLSSVVQLARYAIREGNHHAGHIARRLPVRHGGGGAFLTGWPPTCRPDFSLRIRGPIIDGGAGHARPVCLRGATKPNSLAYKYKAPTRGSFVLCRASITARSPKSRTSRLRC